LAAPDLFLRPIGVQANEAAPNAHLHMLALSSDAAQDRVIRLLSPGIGKSRIDDHDQPVLCPGLKNHLAAWRKPFITERLGELALIEPKAGKVTALRRSVRIDRAPAATGPAVLAPRIHRLAQFLDVEKLAAERAGPTLSPCAHPVRPPASAFITPTDPDPDFSQKPGASGCRISESRCAAATFGDSRALSD